MKKISKEILKDIAHKLMFDMDESQYDSLLCDFDIILQQMDFIAEIGGIDSADPMVFPYDISSSLMRDDDCVNANSVSFTDERKKEGEFLFVPKVIK